jgi:uncharacterized protein
MQPVRITLPDGTIVSSDERDLDRILSEALYREVALEAAERGNAEVGEASSPNNPRAAQAEEYWPDMDGLD